MNRIKSLRYMWILTIAFGIMSAASAVAAERTLYSAKGKRDPFVSLVVTGGARQAASGLMSIENLDDIRIEGVVIDADPAKSIVMANGTVMKQGEEVGNVKLLKIRADGAEFSVNGVEGFRPLYQENK